MRVPAASVTVGKVRAISVQVEILGQFAGGKSEALEHAPLQTTWAFVSDDDDRDNTNNIITMM